MFIYDGASAIIRKKNDSNDFKVRITKINESDTELILGLQLVEPKEDEDLNLSVKINKSDGKLIQPEDKPYNEEENNITFFLISDEIVKNKFVTISKVNNGSDEDTDNNSTIAKVIDINNETRTVSFLINNTTSFDIDFNQLKHLSFKQVTKQKKQKKQTQVTSKKAPPQKSNEVEQDKEDVEDNGEDIEQDKEDVEDNGEDIEEEVDSTDEVEVEYLNTDVFRISPKEKLINSMEHNLRPSLREIPRNSIKIDNECESLFALNDVVEVISLRQRKINKGKIEQFLNDDSPNVPSWILPIAHNKKKIYKTGTETTDLITNARNKLQTEDTSNRRAIDEQYGDGYKKERDEFTRPFEETESDSTQSNSFPKYTLTESIIKKGGVISMNKQNTMNNIIQVFIPSDKILFERNADTMCIIKDLRRYSRVFVPTTNIYEKIYETSDRSTLSGVKQKELNLSDNKTDGYYTYTSKLPELKENIEYVVSQVENKDKSRLNLLVNASALVDQLNFSNFYWHDIHKSEWMNAKAKATIKKTQKTLKLYIKESIQNYKKNNSYDVQNKLYTRSLNIFGNSIFYNISAQCEEINNGMIDAYNLPNDNICDSEALNKMMNIDYGDAYYKYLNFCNSNIEIVGGDLNIEDYYEEQKSLLCGNHAINNMFGEKKVISDFENMEEEYIDGKLNLSYVCLDCERKIKSQKDIELCVNDDGNYDSGVIMKAIKLLGYDMVIYPESHSLVIEKCDYFPNMDSYNNVSKDLLNVANNMLSDTYIGTIVYLKRHFTAFRLSEDKTTLEYIDSLKLSDSKTIGRDTNDMYSFLKQLIDNRVDNDGSIYTIINVHHKIVHSMESQGNNDVIELFNKQIPRYGFIEIDQGDVGSQENINNEEIDQGDKDENNDSSEKGFKMINSSINRKNSKLIGDGDNGDDDDDEEEEENKNLQKYVEIIKNSIHEYDNYTCHKYKVENQYDMIQSLNVIIRLRDIENKRLLKYQIENYVKVESIDVKPEIVKRLIESTSQESEEKYYTNLLLSAMADSSSGWSNIVEIKRSLGNNVVQTSRKIKNGDDNDDISDVEQIWLETIYEEKTVKVMPYYYIELSNFFVFGEGSLNDIISTLMNNKSISYESGTYVCNYYRNALPISVDMEPSETSFHTSTLSNIPSSDSGIVIDIRMPDSSHIFKRFMQEYFSNFFGEDNINSLHVNQVIRKYLPLWNDNVKKILNNTDKEKKIQLLCVILIIGIQASPYFCRKRTVNFVGRDKMIVLGVNAINGYPAAYREESKNTDTDTDTLVYYMSKRLEKRKNENGQLSGIQKSLKEQISSILGENQSIYKEIKDNADVLTKDIPGNDWYERQWSNFYPPLFPVKSQDLNVQVPKNVCSSKNKYSEKFLLLKHINNLSINNMYEKNQNIYTNYNQSTDNTSKSNNYIRSFEKLTHLCYNVPATANYIVSKTQTPIDIIEEVKVFNFSDNFRKRFIEFYCSKGPQSVVDLCKRKENNNNNITITNDKNNQEWFTRVLKSVNRTSMNTTFMKTNKKSETRNTSEIRDESNTVNKNDLLKDCPVRNTSVKEFNNDIESKGFNNYITDLKLGHGDGELSIQQFSIMLNECGYDKEIIKEVDNIFVFTDVNERSIYNFIKVNVMHFVNVMSIKQNKNMKKWHLCWKANMEYYKYSHNVFDNIIHSTNEHDHVIAKMKFVLKYILCMAIASSTKEEKGDVVYILKYCLDKIEANKKCMNMGSTELRNKLDKQSNAERNAQVNLDKYDSELRKQLKKAGIHREQNRRRNIDVGIGEE